MNTPELHQVPSMAALIAFESAARNGNFSRAAKELGISQPAISRQIARLEKQLTIRLFERSPDGVTLTGAGMKFREAVTSGLNLIHEGAVDASRCTYGEHVVITCLEDTSHCFLLPRYRALQQAVGEAATIRIRTYHRHGREIPLYPVADIILGWEASMEGDEYVVLRDEVAGPVCSPRFAEVHKETLRQPVSRWCELPFLDLNRPNLGWASWEDWFRKMGCPWVAPQRELIDIYAYVLDAAAHGQGIALGSGDFMLGYLDSGRLIPLAQGFVSMGKRLCGKLTARGQDKPVANQCLAFLAQCR